VLGLTNLLLCPRFAVSPHRSQLALFKTTSYTANVGDMIDTKSAHYKPRVPI